MGWCSPFAVAWSCAGGFIRTTNRPSKPSGCGSKAMSEENVEIVLGQFESTNARDFAAVTDEWAEDVTAAAHIEGISGPVGTGREAVAEWFWNFFREFASDWRSEVEEFRDLGDRVLIVARHH